MKDQCSPHDGGRAATTRLTTSIIDVLIPLIDSIGISQAA